MTEKELQESTCGECDHKDEGCHACWEGYDQEECPARTRERELIKVLETIAGSDCTCQPVKEHCGYTLCAVCVAREAIDGK